MISLARYISSSVNEKIKQGTVSGELDHVIIKHGTLTGELHIPDDSYTDQLIY